MRLVLTKESDGYGVVWYGYAVYLQDCIEYQRTWVAEKTAYHFCSKLGADKFKKLSDRYLFYGKRDAQACVRAIKLALKRV